MSLGEGGLGVAFSSVGFVGCGVEGDGGRELGGDVFDGRSSTPWRPT